jgi:hypothetical protein
VKALFAICIILLFKLPTVFAIELKTELQIIPQVQEYLEGDIVEIDLKIWPIENADLQEFKKASGITLFDSLEIIEITSVENSENNADLVQIKATAVVVKSKNSNQSFIPYKGTNIYISPKNYKVIPLKAKQEDFYILDQEGIGRNYIILPILLVIATLAAAFVFWKKRKKHRGTKLDIEKNYSLLFANADSRVDYEYIYANRKVWVPFLKAETNAHRDFFKNMETHQYKRNWTSDEAADVKDSFENIRRSFL